MGASTRIAGGRLAESGEFPYAVGIRKSNQTGAPFCGGGLISTEYVLTAAQCLTTLNYNTGVYAPEEIEVMVGRTDVKNETEGFVVKVKEIFIHRGYNPNGYANNIAVITLATKVKLSNTVQTISIYDDTVKQGMVLSTVGWGYYDTNLEQPTVMKAVNVPVVQCQEEYVNQFCAGDNSAGFCQRDTGGIAAVNQNGTWYAVGIASYNIGGCGVSGTIDIFIRVKDYMVWMMEQGAITNSAVKLIPTTSTTVMSVLLLLWTYLLAFL